MYDSIHIKYIHIVRGQGRATLGVGGNDWRGLPRGANVLFLDLGAGYMGLFNL